MRLSLIALLCAVIWSPSLSVDSGAHAQAGTEGAPGAAKEAPAPDALRIRGLVASVESGSVALQLSQGISVKVELSQRTPMFLANSIEQKDLSLGTRLLARTRTGAQGANVAIEVMAMAEPQPGAAEAEALPELTFQGVLKTQEESAGERTLVLTEKGVDRRVTLGPETSFWRLRQAALDELKPGMSLSVVILRDAGGEPRPQRAVFGPGIAGAQLPL